MLAQPLSFCLIIAFHYRPLSDTTNCPLDNLEESPSDKCRAPWHRHSCLCAMHRMHQHLHRQECLCHQPCSWHGHPGRGLEFVHTSRGAGLNESTLHERKIGNYKSGFPTRRKSRAKIVKSFPTGRKKGKIPLDMNSAYSLNLEATFWRRAGQPKGSPGG